MANSPACESEGVALTPALVSESEGVVNTPACEREGASGREIKGWNVAIVVRGCCRLYLQVVKFCVDGSHTNTLENRYVGFSHVLRRAKSKIS